MVSKSCRFFCNTFLRQCLLSIHIGTSHVGFYHLISPLASMLSLMEISAISPTLRCTQNAAAKITFLDNSLIMSFSDIIGVGQLGQPSWVLTCGCVEKTAVASAAWLSQQWWQQLKVGTAPLCGNSPRHPACVVTPLMSLILLHASPDCILQR